MGFDIPNLHLDESSPEGRVVREIVDREGVSPEEAIRRAIRGGSGAKRDPRAIIGLFSSPENQALMDEVMDVVKENRERTFEHYRRLADERD